MRYLQPIRVGRARAVGALGLLLAAAWLGAASSAGATSPLGSPFRVSHAGNLSGYQAENPAVASSTRDARHLVVWQGTSPSPANEFEIYGRIVDSAGAAVTVDFRISSVPTTSPSPAGGFSPDVAYNSQLNEYFVVWQANVPGADTRVQGQRVGPTGALIGANLNLSPATGFAQEPEVTYDPKRDRFLVVWMYTTSSDREVYAQRLDGAGVLAGGHTRLSEMGADGVAGYHGQYPEVDYNDATDEYLAVWHGRDAAADGDKVFAQRVSALGVPVGGDIQVSDMGDGSSSYGATLAVVAANDRDGQYAVAWRGTDNAPGMAPGEVELFGQILDGSGSQVGADDFRITRVGPDGSAAATICGRLSAAYGSRENEYVVVGCAQESSGGRRIVSQAMTAAGLLLPPFAPTASGAGFEVHSTGLAYSFPADQFLAAWQQGAGATPPQEIFARRLGNAAPTARFTWTPPQPGVGDEVCFDGSSSSDEDGAVVSWRWDLDDDGAYDDGASISACRSFPAPGTYQVGLEVTDDDGASDAVRQTVTVVDDDPPTSSHSCAPRPCDEWQPGPAEVTIESDDAVSAVAEIRYRINDRPWVRVVGDRVQFEVGGSGANSISYYAIDAAGNQEAARPGTVRIDRTGPQAAVDPAGGPIRAGTITGTATDDLSGVASIEVTFVDTSRQLMGRPDAVSRRTATCTGCPSGTSVLWHVSTAGLRPGTYAVTARATDRAGNVGAPSDPPQTFVLVGPPGL